MLQCSVTVLTRLCVRDVLQCSVIVLTRLCVVVSLTRMLMLLGFGAVSPSFSLVPAEGRDDYVFMVNTLEDEDDEEDTDSDSA